MEENTETYLHSIIRRMRVRMHCTVTELRIVFNFTYKDKTDAASVYMDYTRKLRYNTLRKETT